MTYGGGWLWIYDNSTIASAAEHGHRVQPRTAELLQVSTSSGQIVDTVSMPNALIAPSWPPTIAGLWIGTRSKAACVPDVRRPAPSTSWPQGHGKCCRSHPGQYAHRLLAPRERRSSLGRDRPRTFRLLPRRPSGVSTGPTSSPFSPSPITGTTRSPSSGTSRTACGRCSGLIHQPVTPPPPARRRSWASTPTPAPKRSWPRCPPFVVHLIRGVLRDWFRDRQPFSTDLVYPARAPVRTARVPRVPHPGQGDRLS